MFKKVIDNSFVQLLIMVCIVTFFNVWLWKAGIGVLSGGYSFEWYALSGASGSLARYFAFLAIPILSCIQGINMINALSNGNWAKKTENLTAFQTSLCKVMYMYVAVGWLLIFLLSIKIFLSM